MHTSRLCCLSLLIVAAGCNPPVPEPPPPPTGSVSAALDVSSALHDVTAVHFIVVAPAADCTAPPIAEQTVPVAPGSLPATVEGGAGKHAYADGLFVLPPGDYRICATPLASTGAPSAECGAASGTTTVIADQTAEVVLISQCQASSNGGADVVVSLNDPPQITAVVIDPSKFITTCDSAKLTASATDPNNDALTYAWTSSAGGILTGDGTTVTFSTRAAGDYTITLAVADGRGGTTSISFPLHVAAAVCAVPAPVQALIDANCSPCHTAGASGGLSMASADVTYASLVDHPSAAAACAARIRVVRGDPASSYIIAKLRNLPPICGVQMPRGKPPLAEEQIAVFEAWIAGLPR